MIPFLPSPNSLDYDYTLATVLSTFYSLGFIYMSSRSGKHVYKAVLCSFPSIYSMWLLTESIFVLFFKTYIFIISLFTNRIVHTCACGPCLAICRQKYICQPCDLLKPFWTEQSMNQRHKNVGCRVFMGPFQITAWQSITGHMYPHCHYMFTLCSALIAALSQHKNMKSKAEWTCSLTCSSPS